MAAMEKGRLNVECLSSLLPPLSLTPPGVLLRLRVPCDFVQVVLPDPSDDELVGGG